MKNFDFGASTEILIVILILFVGMSFAVSTSFKDFLHLAWHSILAVFIVFSLSVILYFIKKRFYDK